MGLWLCGVHAVRAFRSFMRRPIYVSSRVGDGRRCGRAAVSCRDFIFFGAMETKKKKIKRKASEEKGEHWMPANEMLDG